MTLKSLIRPEHKLRIVELDEMLWEMRHCITLVSGNNNRRGRNKQQHILAGLQENSFEKYDKSSLKTNSVLNTNVGFDLKKSIFMDSAVWKTNNKLNDI